MSAPTVAGLIAATAHSLSISEEHVAWLAERHLRKAGLLPPEDSDPVTPEHAARLLVAVMAVQRPIDTVEALKIYEELPARRRFMTKPSADGTASYQWDKVEDLPILPGCGQTFAIFSKGIVAALAALIDWASQDAAVPAPFISDANAKLPPSVVPRFVTVSRDLDNPMAFIEADVSLPDQPSAYVTLMYSHGDDAAAAYALGELRLQLLARTSAAILRTLGALFADSACARPAKVQAQSAAALESGAAT